MLNAYIFAGLSLRNDLWGTGNRSLALLIFIIQVTHIDIPGNRRIYCVY